MEENQAVEPQTIETEQEQQVKTYDESYVKELRNESAKYRTKNKELQQQFDDFKQNLLSQLGIRPGDDFEKQINHWKNQTQQANNRLLQAEIKSVSTDLGIIDHEAAGALLNHEGLEISEDGMVKGAKEALEALIESKPYLVKSTDEKQPTKGGQEFQSSGSKRITREDLKRMSPSEINQALAAGDLKHLLGG